MKILAVADAEERALGEHFNPERWQGVELVLSLGDLKADYLDYLVTRLNVPLLYVRGSVSLLRKCFKQLEFLAIHTPIDERHEHALNKALNTWIGSHRRGNLHMRLLPVL